MMGERAPVLALALTGPTASGKTGLSIEIAKRLGCEIVSLDSMQIYRGMDIGTAKVTKAEMQGIVHHMLDVCEPCECFSAEDYKAMAMECARDISRRGKTPLFVGGTGLYLETLSRVSSSVAPKSDKRFCEALLRAVNSNVYGRDMLYERVYGIDPETAEAAHKNNVKRLIRALEIWLATGKTKSELDKDARDKNPEIEILHVTLDFHDRELLYKRVNDRVDEMMRMGLLDETERLFRLGYLDGKTTASQAIGYKEMLPVITEGGDLSSAISELKLGTRRYAKRQLTWFRHNGDAERVFVDTEEGVLRQGDELLAEIEAKYERMKKGSKDEF